jgi:hypothetical protein
MFRHESPTDTAAAGGKPFQWQCWLGAGVLLGRLHGAQRYFWIMLDEGAWIKVHVCSHSFCFIRKPVRVLQLSCLWLILPSWYGIEIVRLMMQLHFQ